MIADKNALTMLDRTLAFIKASHEAGKALGRGGAYVELGPTPVGADGIKLLVDTVRSEQPSKTLETGFAFGFSGLALVSAMLDVGVEQPSHTAIDPCQFGRHFDGAGVEAFRQLGLEQYLDFRLEGSETVLPGFVSEEQSFDMGFVDGSHWFEHAFLDIYYMSKLIKPGGLIMVDDMWMPAVRQAVDYFAKNLGLTHENARAPRRGILGRNRNVRANRRSSQCQVAFLRVPEPSKPRPWDDFKQFHYKW